MIAVKAPLALETGCRKQPSQALLNVYGAPSMRMKGFGIFKIRKGKLAGSCLLALVHRPRNNHFNLSARCTFTPTNMQWNPENLLESTQVRRQRRHVTLASIQKVSSQQSLSYQWSFPQSHPYRI